MTTSDWRFSDPPNVAVFTSHAIARGVDWIYYVSHDEDDGGWQFHGKSGITSPEDAALVALSTIVVLDRRLEELADLPIGWCAWRDEPSAPWQRAPIES